MVYGPASWVGQNGKAKTARRVANSFTPRVPTVPIIVEGSPAEAWMSTCPTRRRRAGVEPEDSSTRCVGIVTCRPTAPVSRHAGARLGQFAN
ncbi:hypothetical protein Ct61P_12799 [Colletotrichum tofieldiae]|nr:hypothetical protein Ct61P_12799 [Colletotrichum tofieldiae]